MKRKNKIIIFICIGVLFLIEFNYNALQTVNPTFFSGFQKDSESLTVGRIKRSNQEGAFSYGGFLGWNHPDTSMLPKESNPINNRFGEWGYKVPDYPDKFQFQYQALSNDLTVGHYELYYSQTGLQVFLYY